MPDFILLARILEVQEHLQAMVISAECSRWHEASTSKGRSVKQRILDDNRGSIKKFGVADLITDFVNIII